MEYEDTVHLTQTIWFRLSSLVTLKIGRWYEFRVAAVNENGTRGYSVPSEPFQLNESQKMHLFIAIPK